jgi:hypothetical protein
METVMLKEKIDKKLKKLSEFIRENEISVFDLGESLIEIFCKI